VELGRLPLLRDAEPAADASVPIGPRPAPAQLARVPSAFDGIPRRVVLLGNR
jgi:hypothetical protein